VKKRNYRDGYYVDWAFSKKKADKKIAQGNTVEKPATKNSINANSIYNSNNDPTVATAGMGVDKTLIAKNHDLTLGIDTCGDQLFFKSGDIIIAKVLEITDDKIKYKRCDNLEGPQFVVLKSSVQSIKYVNGVTENIEPSAASPYTEPSPQPQHEGPQKVHPKAIGSLIACIFGFVPFLFMIPFIVSVVMSKNAIKEIDANPKIYKGRLLAEIARGISLFMLILLGVILVVFLIAVLIYI